MQQLAGADVNIIFGVMYDDSKKDTCSITVIATGIGQQQPAGPKAVERPKASQPARTAAPQTGMARPSFMSAGNPVQQNTVPQQAAAQPVPQQTATRPEMQAQAPVFDTSSLTDTIPQTNAQAIYQNGAYSQPRTQARPQGAFGQAPQAPRPSKNLIKIDVPGFMNNNSRGGAAPSDEDAFDEDDEPGDAEKAETTAPAPAPAAAQSAYKSELPADYDDQLKANRTARTDLRKKLNDGEIDADEFDAKLTELEDQRDELSRQKTRAEIAAEMQAQAQQNEWSNTINSFIGDAASKPELGIVDYRKDLEKQADLDTFVKALAAVPANVDKPSRWFLEEAHKRVVALHGIPTSKKPADNGKRKADASEVVTNLADVPGGAGDADPVSDRFAELDKLTGPDYERALAKLTAEERHQYMMSA